MNTTRLSIEDFAYTSYGKACTALGVNPLNAPGRLGHTVREVERSWQQAIKDERAGVPMPSVPAHQPSLMRELRLIAKRALTAQRLLDNELERVSAERAALLEVLD